MTAKTLILDELGEGRLALPETINRALIAEVDALRAQRSADAAEVDAILSELKPMIEEAS